MRWHLHTFVALLALIVVGCDTSRSDMGDQPSIRTYESSVAFADGSGARPFVAGTVSRDGATHAPHVDEVVTLDTANPLPINRDLLDRGQSAFDVSCSICHGRLGDGNGMIVQRGFSRPPSFHVPRLKAAPDAHFYNVITHGYGAMFSYNDRVVPEDRWAIVAYIRALQAASDDASLPGDVRAALLEAGDPNAPKGGAW